MAGQSRHAATLDLRESDGPSPDLSTNLSPRTNSLGVDDLFSISVRDSGSGLDPQLSTLLIDLGVGISAGLGVEFLKTLWSSEILRRLRQEVGSDAVGRRLSIRVEQVSDEGIRHTRVDVIEEG